MRILEVGSSLLRPPWFRSQDRLVGWGDIASVAFGISAVSAGGGCASAPDDPQQRGEALDVLLLECNKRQSRVVSFEQAEAVTHGRAAGRPRARTRNLMDPIHG
jgi:hypothetical protein